jgi:hypothetical protein
MVRKVAENGAVYHARPYTWEEERDFYRRIAGGPVTVLHAPKEPLTAKKTPQPKTQPRPPAK